MIIDENLVNYIVKPKHIISYVVFIIFITVSLGIASVLITERIVANNLEIYTRQIKLMTNSKDYDVRTLCSVINCKKIYMEYDKNVLLYLKDSDTIHSTSKEEIPMEFFGAISNEFDSIVRYNGFTIVLNNDDVLEVSIDLYFTFLVIFILLFTYIFYVLLYNNYMNFQYDKGYFKNYIENKSQRNITETIHHEMAVPITIIRTLITNMYNLMYSDRTIEYKRSYDASVKNDISNIYSAIERLEAILEMLRSSKQIKNTIKNISILDICKNIIQTVSCFKIGAIKGHYTNADILSMYKIEGISNGMFLNIVQVMVNNAVEAGATEIDFTLLVQSDNKMGDLYIKDNGIGIRDKYRNIIKPENTGFIYKYGYSTKNGESKNEYSDNKFYKLLAKIGINIHKSSDIRGIGLNLNKETLRGVGGGIIVVDTSPKGTTFKLTFPVSKIYDVPTEKTDKSCKIIPDATNYEI